MDIDNGSGGVEIGLSSSQGQKEIGVLQEVFGAGLVADSKQGAIDLRRVRDGRLGRKGTGAVAEHVFFWMRSFLLALHLKWNDAVSWWERVLPYLMLALHR